MRILTLSLLTILSLKSIAESEEFTDHDVHQHGHAETYISFIDQVAKVKLVLPSVDIFGFEHKPNDEQQLNQVRLQIPILENSQNLFSINLPCNQIHAKIESSILDEIASDNTHEHDDEHHHEEIESHSNVIVNYEFKCESNHDAQINFNLFKSYPTIEKLELKFVSNESQSTTVLTPENSRYYFP
jgi:hypothetical protein|tara:strand:+ start:420 stop:977 length:558 start_codon:yes stop_codon:yes gene_type:complete